MSADKRTVTTDALETLGSIISENEKRDAIHLAVEPVVAAENLSPGSHVGFVEGGVGISEDPVGIVDPFLTEPVQKGQRFWLVVYPRQITSLRHVWAHPAFDDAEAAPSIDKKAASEAWLRQFIATADCPGYEVVIGAAMGGGIRDWGDGGYLHFEDQDAHGDIPDEFWDHVEIVTGCAGLRRAKYFSCHC